MLGASHRKAASGTDPAGLVLGVDPGTVVTGWGLVREHGAQLTHVASGVVRLRGDRAERLVVLHRELCEICARFVPELLSLEKSFVGENVQTAFRLGEARGVAMVAAAQSGARVEEFSPAEIKIGVSGSGRASKSQVQFMVRELLKIDRELVADEADALAAAICALHARRLSQLLREPVRGSVGAVPRGRSWRALSPERIAAMGAKAGR